MAFHIKVKTPENELVHIDAPFGVTYTLCGLETAGDMGLGIEEGVITSEKVNCRHCINITMFCKKIKKSEINPLNI